MLQKYYKFLFLKSKVIFRNKKPLFPFVKNFILSYTFDALLMPKLAVLAP